MNAHTDTERNTPLVSILIPAYNRERLVGRAIESALRQTYRRIEVICCDNHSADGTFSVMQEFARQDPRVRCFRNETNRGASRNWLRCFEESRGDYIKLVFSDDWLTDNAVERMVAALEASPECGFSYSAVTYYNDGVAGFDPSHVANSLGEDQKVPAPRFLHGFLTGSISVPNSPGQALFRRKDFSRWLSTDDHNRMGLPLGDHGMGNDCLLYFRACGEYPFAYHIAEPLASYRIHPGSISISHWHDDIGAIGTMSAFAHFLCESALDDAVKSRFASILWVKFESVNLKKCLRPWSFRTAVRHFRLLFPNDRCIPRIRHFHPDVFRYTLKELLRIWKLFVNRR